MQLLSLKRLRVAGQQTCMPNAIDAEFVMDSCFAELSDLILSSCLRLTSFEAKLRCQQVCTSWRSLLKRSAAPGDDRGSPAFECMG